MRGKPAGSIVRLSRFKWYGDDEPLLDHFLVSRSGTSGYRIIGIEETAKSGVEYSPRVFHLVCEKVEPKDVPPERLLGELWWDKR